jgi:hypothetical protein
MRDADAVYQRAIQANVGWFQLQVALDHQPPEQVEFFREALSDAAILDPVADRTRQLLGLVLRGDLPAAQKLAAQWVTEAATAYAEREWERSDDREAA